MKTVLVLASGIALLVGCASQKDVGYGGPGYGPKTEADYGSYKEPTQQGAGAAAMTGSGGIVTQSQPAGTVQTPVGVESYPEAAGAPAAPVAPAAGAATAGQLSESDMKFVQEAGQHSEGEIKMGQLLAQNSPDPAVRNFGQRLVDDHTRILQQLQQIAAQKGATVPTSVDPHHQQQLDYLATLSGTDLDNAALKDAVRSHERDIKTFQNAAQTLEDPDLRAFAQQTIPTLQQHLALAKQLQSSTATASPTEMPSESPTAPPTQVPSGTPTPPSTFAPPPPPPAVGTPPPPPQPQPQQ